MSSSYNQLWPQEEQLDQLIFLNLWCFCGRFQIALLVDFMKPFIKGINLWMIHVYKKLSPHLGLKNWECDFSHTKSSWLMTLVWDKLCGFIHYNVQFMWCLLWHTLLHWNGNLRSGHGTYYNRSHYFLYEKTHILLKSVLGGFRWVNQLISSGLVITRTTDSPGTDTTLFSQTWSPTKGFRFLDLRTN
jgi:hypothetical protein